MTFASWPATQNNCKPSSVLWPPTVLRYTWKSVAKTKVMVVSKPSVRVPPPVATVFTCNGLPVEHVDTFKYLGLHFHTSGGISHLIAPLKAKAARS